MKGPNKSCRSSEAIIAIAIASADLVSIESQNITAYPTVMLLNVEKICPDQIIANFFLHSVMVGFLSHKSSLACIARAVKIM